MLCQHALSYRQGGPFFYAPRDTTALPCCLHSPILQFMLAAGRALGPGVEVEALDSEEFYGVSLDALAAL